MWKLLLIGAGGAVGTLARYGTSLAFHNATRVGRFPVGTLTVNLIGCLLIGLLNGALLTRWQVPETYRLAIVVGFLGGYTTFSAYAWEVAEMLRSGRWVAAASYLLASNVLGVALVVAGSLLGRARVG